MRGENRLTHVIDTFTVTITKKNIFHKYLTENASSVGKVFHLTQVFEMTNAGTLKRRKHLVEEDVF